MITVTVHEITEHTHTETKEINDEVLKEEVAKTDKQKIQLLVHVTSLTIFRVHTIIPE